jgi:hypothetical protein
MVTVEARLIEAPDSNSYRKGPINYSFLRKYLEVFDEVIVLVRMKEENQVDLAKLNGADGRNARVLALPHYIGPWQYLRQFILRIPGQVSILLRRHLMRRQIPYGVGVMGSSLDSVATGHQLSLATTAQKTLDSKSDAAVSLYCCASTRY